MRFELAGSLVHPAPMVLKFETNQTFDPAVYINLGYTHFEVICIGGGGGQGGKVDSGAGVRSVGGHGGGGGFHRVRGLLSALPVSCPIVVGGAGTPGASHATDPAQTTNGGNGGQSLFNDPTCRASGGEGGHRAQSNTTTAPTYANGGQGGVGNHVNYGGGATGGVAGTPSDTGPGTPGTSGIDGTLFNDVGQGGGGGAGGVSHYNGTLCNAGTAGGRGSYNPGDTSVYGPAGAPTHDYPGAASGAKAAPLNGLPTVYGKSATPGIVIVRLTAE